MKGRPYGEFAKQIFLALGIAGVIVVVATAPGAVLALKLFEYTKTKPLKNYKQRSTVRSFQALQKNKFIEVKEKQGKFEIRLTKKGEEKFRDIRLHDLRIAKPPVWDKKWRVVIFDIPDKSLKRAREILRGKLKQWEFYPLQKSVWVCPWPCEDEIQLTAELYEVSPYVNIIVADKITNDTLVRKHFGL